MRYMEALLGGDAGGSRRRGVRRGWARGGDWGRGIWGSFVCQDERWEMLPAKLRVQIVES